MRFLRKTQQVDRWVDLISDHLMAVLEEEPEQGWKTTRKRTLQRERYDVEALETSEPFGAVELAAKGVDADTTGAKGESHSSHLVWKTSF